MASFAKREWGTHMRPGPVHRLLSTTHIRCVEALNNALAPIPRAKGTTLAVPSHQVKFSSTAPLSFRQAALLLLISNNLA
jgi:hypothetical protein